MGVGKMLAAAVFGVFAVASVAGAATIDTTTKGNWIGVYGHDGYILNDYNRVAANSGMGGVYDSTADPANDAKSLPSYVSGYSYTNGEAYVWESNNTTDTRFPQNPANPSGPRVASTVFHGADWGTTITLSQPTQFQLGIYALDYERAGRKITVTVGGDSATIAAPEYGNGGWLLFNVNAPAGPLPITIQHLGAANATISAITFDPVPEPSAAGLVGVWGLSLLARRRRRANVDRTPA